MSSHRPQGGRIPRPREFTLQSRNASSPAITSAVPSGEVYISQFPKPQMNSGSRTSRASSVSEAEQTRPILAPARPSRPSRVSSNNDVRSSLLPRSKISSLPRVSSRSPSNPSTSQPILAPPAPTPKTDKQTSSNDRLQNSLRRKAPTIGQGTGDTGSIGATRPGKLSVIIPNSVRPTQAINATPRTPWDQPELARLRSSPNVSQRKIANKTPTTEAQGPKELASLRGVVNTQNLPPPTPIINSASSPSTRYSSSPGIWSIRSRESTPTSLSSYSPGIVQPTKVSYRLRQPSPYETRLPFFSPPIPQSSPLSDQVEQNVSKSPYLGRVTGSSTSLVSGEPDNSSKKTQTPGATASTNSLLPRRSSMRSNLPTKTNPETATTNKKEEGIHSRSFERRGSEESAKTTIPPKDLSQSPSRPSREGTHRLELEPSPVIRSNIAPKSVTSHKRRESAENAPAVGQSQPPSNQPTTTSLDSLHSRSASQITLPPTSSPILSRKSPRTLIKEPKEKQSAKTPAPAKRFSLFPKKSKSDMDKSTLDKIQSARKGPAAGTGHEGYGKYAQRGRRTSVGSSSGVRTRSTSTTRSTSKTTPSSKGSAKGRPDLNMDDFLLHRLEPVVINGGGLDEATLTRTQSEQSIPSILSSSASTLNLANYRKGSQSTGYSASTDSLATSTGTIGEIKESSNLSKPDTDSGSDQTIKPVISMAHETKKTTPHRDAIPAPSHLSQYSLSVPQASAPVHPQTREPEPKHKSPKKKGKSSMWNFFQRSHGADRKKSSTPQAPVNSVPHLHATIAPVAVNRPVAHYALVDTDSDTLEDIVHKIEDSPPTENEEPSSPVEVPAALNIRKPRESTLLPSPPQFQGEFSTDRCASPKVYFNKDPITPGSPAKSPEKTPEDRRPSRLASIGRIPRVVSRRDRQHRPAMQSFSRPFSFAESPSLLAPVTDRSHGRSMSDRSVLDFQTEEPPRKPFNPGFDITKPFGDPSQGSVLDFIAGPYAKHEFLTFSPGKGSMLSSPSDSDGLATVTAVVPDPSSEPTEDEVWGEYDDLIDHVLSPETSRSVNPTQANGEEKFELATMASKMLQAELNGNLDRRALPTPTEKSTTQTPTSSRSSGNSIRLRRSRIVSALRSSTAPSSQPSYNELVAKYGDPQSEEEVKTAPINLATSNKVEQQSNLVRSPSLNISQSFETSRQRNTVLFDIAERDREGSTAQTNLRSGSLMTSRWLSFGRVLFSPAHNHVKSGEQERILVIDGLGNDDWSFYCSLTYPNADVYNLDVGPPPSTAPKHPSAWQPPSNHHTVHHTSLENPVPFPKGFFAATVLRFPAVCPESVQDNIVAECKRVLRPGGYMEMSLLDLDMVNMGIRTRKAVRQLKERTYLADANISLKPTSDSIQRFLGRHGFDNLRRCMVRIPVAGVIVRSSASSSSTSSSHSNPSMSAAATSTFSLPATSAMPSSHGKYPSNDTNLSLGDLLSDPSPSNDESIRKTVARVGRWWYTRCYEIPVLPDGDVDLSIWADRKVLRECQRRGTGFRLLIAYAQKPSEVKRRTASV